MDNSLHVLIEWIQVSGLGTEHCTSWEFCHIVHVIASVPGRSTKGCNLSARIAPKTGQQLSTLYSATYHWNESRWRNEKKGKSVACTQSKIPRASLYFEMTLSGKICIPKTCQISFSHYSLRYKQLDKNSSSDNTQCALVTKPRKHCLSFERGPLRRFKKGTRRVYLGINGYWFSFGTYEQKWKL